MTPNGIDLVLSPFFSSFLSFFLSFFLFFAVLQLHTEQVGLQVDASGLTTGIQYAFRFQVDRITSDVGTFR